MYVNKAKILHNNLYTYTYILLLFAKGHSERFEAVFECLMDFSR